MNLAIAASSYRLIRDRIRAEDPQIDEQALADTVEGLTDLHEILTAVIRAALADQALATGLEGHIGLMQARRDRLQDRATKRRQIAKDVMVELDLKKLSAPDFTASIRPGMPSLTVIDEAAVPSIYWEPREPRLNRQGLANASRARTSPALPSPTPLLYRGLVRDLGSQRIFGFDGWSRETVESRCVLARENRGAFLAVYTARVRISVQAGGTMIIREGHGSGEGRGASPGEVHDTALKAAETDATKRALATFGKPFGLALYKAGKPPSIQPTMPVPSDQAEPVQRFGFHPDDTTPIPRPSRYYGRRQYAPLTDQLRKNSADHKQASSAPPLVPNGLDPVSGRIDKSQLAFADPKRLRDKAHLKFVASQPCLICGRQPSDPHHLRFAQPRGIGLKVSDEFTVPLCRGHHRQLHQAGNEARWWENLQIDALAIAKDLWKQTHTKHVCVDPQIQSTTIDTRETTVKD